MSGEIGHDNAGRGRVFSDSGDGDDGLTLSDHYCALFRENLRGDVGSMVSRYARQNACGSGHPDEVGCLRLSAEGAVVSNESNGRCNRTSQECVAHR